MSLWWLLPIVLGMFALRQNIAMILLVVVAYLHFFFGDGELTYIPEDVWTSIDTEVLLPIPLFILCGGVMSHGSIAEKLIRVITLITSPLPGGLAIAAVVSCAIFAAISGSSPVTLLAVGAIMYPALIKNGYSRSFSIGALTSAGTLGILIPPSIPMILYGISTETPVTDMFFAGIVPGIILTVALSIYALIVNRHLKGNPWDFREIAKAIKDGFFALMMPIVLLGGIFSGYFTATESAAIALAYSAFIEAFVYRQLDLKGFFTVAMKTTTLLGTLFPVLALALSLNHFLVAEGWPDIMANWMVNNIETQAGFMLGMNVLLLVIGFFMDSGSAILMLSPILQSLGESYNINSVHLGIIMIMNLEVGFLSPPMGLNLIVAVSAFNEKFGTVCKAVLPFIAIILCVLVLIVCFPALTLVFV